nr:putative ribonuclease H-like domain-containing protein [Tanacetum cinerariifolium]
MEVLVGSSSEVKVMRKRCFGVDAVEDFKKYTLRDYYCWLKTYYCCGFGFYPRLLTPYTSLKDKDMQESKDPQVIRIEQYFIMTDYSLWEVILNGDSPIPTRVINGVVQPFAPTTTEQRLARKNELKARDSPFNLVGYSDSDYARASLDRKSTTGGCQFLGCRLISWQCKKQTVVATSSTEAEYVAIASCCAQVLWIQNLLLDYGRKVIITEDTIRQALHLDDAEVLIVCPMKRYFLSWTTWNEFSSSIASAVICLATGRRFNVSKYIFDSLVRNVDSSTKFYMYPRFLQLMISAQITDLSSHTTKYTSYALTQKVFANMQRVGKRFSGVDTPLFKGMLVPQQAADVVADDVATNDVANADAEPTPPSPTPTTPPPPQQEVTSNPPSSPHQSPIAQLSSPPPQQPLHDTTISMDLLNTLLKTYTTLTRKVKALEQDKIAQAFEITKLKQRVRRLENKNKLKVLRKVGTAQKDVTLEEVATEVEKDVEVAKKDIDAQGRLEESQAQVYHIDLEHAKKVLSMQDDEAEPAELKEVIEVVTTTKLMAEVVTAAATPTPITAAPSAARRRKGVVIRDPKETATPSIIVHSESKSKDKGKGILVKRKEKQDNAVLRYQALKRKPQTEAQARKNMMHFNSIMGFLEKSDKELEENASKALKRKSKSSKQQAAKKQKLDEKVEELKTHLQIVANDEDDVYTKATPLALKVLVVDYQIHTENNKPYYKIIRADGTHQLFLSFISLLMNFDREDLEMLWKIVQERFASSKLKNFSDDFLLNTLKAMFEKPNVEAHIWKNQRGSYGLAKVKSWKLLESCGVYI